jgi:hypothetical protein
LFPTDILGLEPVGFGVATEHSSSRLFLDLHHLLNVHVQLANKMGLKETAKKINQLLAFRWKGYNYSRKRH